MCTSRSLRRQQPQNDVDIDCVMSRLCRGDQSHSFMPTRVGVASSEGICMSHTLEKLRGRGICQHMARPLSCTEAQVQPTWAAELDCCTSTDLHSQLIASSRSAGAWLHNCNGCAWLMLYACAQKEDLGGGGAPRLKANCASLVMASHSSNMTILYCFLKTNVISHSASVTTARTATRRY